MGVTREEIEYREMIRDRYGDDVAGPVLFTEEERAAMAADPVAFGLACRSCGSGSCSSLDPRGDGDCYAGFYDEPEED